MRSHIVLITLFMATPAVADMYAELRNVYETNPVIGRARSDVDVARSDLNIARGGYKPYLGAAANVGLARTTILNNDYDYVPTQVGVEFQQNIFSGFSTVARIKAAKNIVNARQSALESTESDVFLAAINAYINVLNARDVLELNENNERVLRKYNETVENRKRVGQITSTDVAQSSARLESAKYNVIGARANYDNALETYVRIYGARPREYTEIETSRMERFFPATVHQATEYAIAHHPALRALDAQVDAAKQEIVVANRGMLPTVDVRASAMQFDDLPILDRVRDGRVGVYLSVPLYDRGHSMASANRARYNVDGIGMDIQNTRDIITENVHRAWNAYTAQDSAIAAATQAVRAAQSALDGVRDEQARGRRTVQDVLNAEQELLGAKISLTRARHEKVSAFFAILAAMGNLTAENLGLVVNGDTD